MSEKDIRQKVERILSDILSDKYDAVITIKFKKERVKNDDKNTSRTIGEKQVPHR